MPKRGFYLISISIVIIFTLVYFLLKRENKRNTDEYVAITPIAVHHNGMKFIDSKICMQCHQQIVENHYKTAHFNSFQIANKNTIKGSFLEDKNRLILNDKESIKMVEKDSGYYQEARIGKQDRPFYSAKMDIVIGSGTKGQSYLMRHQDQLFQLQASYFTPTDSWINSPGAVKKLAPARPVIERCLECHTTYAQNVSGNKNGNRFHKTNIVYGIDCQRCHGEVSEHVKYHQLHPEETIGQNIMKYNSLSRQQRLDACGLCHSGLRKQFSKGAFDFNAGDILDNLSSPDYDENDLGNLDVHGNQYGLLKASTCFQKSNNLDCTTCHNPHKKERGNHASFNQKCVACHSKMSNPIACGEDQLQIQEMGNNCIQCHMPLIDSKTMKVQVSNKDEISVKVRTHLIGLYNEQNLE
ncbi:multiheme c-type cytochrome [Aquimarina gracilis]|uniref:Multiheme c-type cytochrome n=1 Tax=Aquimarina gracilis TaxID=874422 RepID=A0ABU5ZUG6_9FLAO|nr:multiheme c-type cytochrome [Aquimarina gracilis]MEB3345197.1 multiheme c-type cytochrome [Aquimarina gracilis]